ncbi:MAG: hypothetical protein ABWZ66_10740, partial [Pyrinomonadaceae bacterium]
MFVQLKKIKGLALPFILFATLAAGVVFTAAQPPLAGIPYSIARLNPSPTPPPNKYPVPTSNPVMAPTPKPYKDKYKEKTKKQIINESETPAEKSIAV